MLHDRCRAQLARFQNGDICKLTEQVIFTDPYYSAPVNRHTSPQLDSLAAQLQSDIPAKVAATALKVGIRRTLASIVLCTANSAV